MNDLVRVKICGLTRAEDLESAVDAGADAVGFVFEPSSPRFVSEDKRDVIRSTPPFVSRVAVFGVLHGRDWFGCDSAQFVDAGAQTLTGVSVLKVMRPTTAKAEGSLAELAAWLKTHEVSVQGVVLDAFDANAFGGTGRTIDWGFAADFVRLSPVPVILAGGLTPDNVARAVRGVRPYAVDVSSGVESSPGIKDAYKVRDFVQAAKGAL